MGIVHDYDLIETLAAGTAEKPLSDRMEIRRLERDPDNIDPGSHCHDLPQRANASGDCPPYLAAYRANISRKGSMAELPDSTLDRILAPQFTVWPRDSTRDAISRYSRAAIVIGGPTRERPLGGPRIALRFFFPTKSDRMEDVS